MFQQISSILTNRSQQVLWLGILAAFITLLLTQSAQAAVIRLQIIFVHAPQQQVDTDGDGKPDPFSADFAVYSDGTASGVISLNKHNNVTLKRGVIGWTADEELVMLEGIHYQRVNGQWLEIGLAQVEVRPAGGTGGGGDIIVFDIVDSANHAESFEATGEWQRDYVAGMMAPATQVDTDGDGEKDSFSADVLLLNDGLATGMVELDSDSRIVLESGAAYCLAGEAVVVAYGTHYQEVNGLWLETGDGRVHGRPAGGGGGGGDIIVFDIVDSVSPSYSFETPGQLLFVADPCAG
jgi:hypothetical protein